MSLKNLVLKQLRRVPPSRYTAMQACLLREVLIISGNEPLLPPSPVAALGLVIHQFFEAAARNQLDGGEHAKVLATWDKLVLETERNMALSAIARHQVPLSRSVPDFHVRKHRACCRAADIAQDALRAHERRPKQVSKLGGYEFWVESSDRRIGGYIDRVKIVKEGVVLCDYKSGLILSSRTGEGPSELKRAYTVQLELYAALYSLTFSEWPVRLEIIPLQGSPVEVQFDRENAERHLAAASTFLLSANQRIAEVQSGGAEIASLASPDSLQCRFCSYRPACEAYWTARRHDPKGKWPFDIQGTLLEKTLLRNGKLCLRVTEGHSAASACSTVRNLTNSQDRYPLLHRMRPGNHITVYGLSRDYRSNDYTETQYTTIYEAG